MISSKQSSRCLWEEMCRGKKKKRHFGGIVAIPTNGRRGLRRKLRSDFFDFWRLCSLFAPLASSTPSLVRGLHVRREKPKWLPSYPVTLEDEQIPLWNTALLPSHDQIIASLGLMTLLLSTRRIIKMWNGVFRPFSPPPPPRPPRRKRIKVLKKCVKYSLWLQLWRFVFWKCAILVLFRMDQVLSLRLRLEIYRRSSKLPTE